MRGNPWIIGLLFLATTAYFGYKYNFDFPTVFASRTKTTKAVIVDYKMVPARNGSRGYQQKIEFAYKVGDEILISKKQISARFGHRPIGSKLQLEYQEDSPTKYLIKTYYKPSHFGTVQKYFRSESTYEYEYVKVNNNVLKHEQFGKKGALISKQFYHVIQKSNSLIVSNLFNWNDTIKTFAVESDGILDVTTNKKFTISEEQ